MVSWSNSSLDVLIFPHEPWNPFIREAYTQQAFGFRGSHPLSRPQSAIIEPNRTTRLIMYQ